MCSIVDAGSLEVVSSLWSEERGIRPDEGGSRESYRDRYSGGGSSAMNQHNRSRGTRGI
jgi:hypothetical protein